MNVRVSPDSLVVGCVLTPRQLEVVRWFSLDKRGADVAVIMGVTTSTVRTHVENIKAVLGLDTVPAVVATCIRRGWI